MWVHKCRSGGQACKVERANFPFKLLIFFPKLLGEMSRNHVVASMLTRTLGA
jgi:hypothetical protein